MWGITITAGVLEAAARQCVSLTMVPSLVMLGAVVRGYNNIQDFLIVFLPDHVRITGYSNKNGRREPHTIHPITGSSVFLRRYGRCSTFHLQNQFLEVKIESPVPSIAIVHGKNQFYSMELSSFYMRMVSYRYFDILISETRDLKTENKPCYAGTSHG